MAEVAQLPQALPADLVVARRRRPVEALGHVVWTGVMSLTVYVAPRWAGRQWVRAALWEALVIGGVNVAVATWAALPRVGRLPFNEIAILEYKTFVAACVAMLLLAVLVGLMFVLLPFAPRPGSNRACLRHVVRTTLLGSSVLYLLWGFLAAVGRFGGRAFDQHHVEYPLRVLAISAGVAGVLVWAVAALGRAVAVEYRRAADLPGPREPQCDECGYDLRMAAAGGRCPECGKPVAESLSPEARQPSSWERAPRPWRVGTIAGQIVELFWAPQRLFRRIPLTTDHGAAHLWLAIIAVLIAGIAFWIIPAVGAIDAWRHPRSEGALSFGPREWPFWAFGLVSGGIWALLALMLVGVETGGLVLAARFRGRRLELAAASKVTCYASTLMLFWVLLGGMQTVGLALYGLWGIYRMVGSRYDEVITAGSTFAAHIGGLLWFELTVYRGLRAIQFANR